MHSANQSAIASYDGLLRQMLAVSDGVIAAVQEMCLEDIERLLGDREILCDKIAQARQVFGGADDSTALPDGTRQLEQLVLAKQAVCESIVSEHLRECRTDLADLRRRQGLRHAYGSSTVSRSCFLDDRM